MNAWSWDWRKLGEGTKRELDEKWKIERRVIEERDKGEI
jgi:hypothetical protein